MWDLHVYVIHGRTLRCQIIVNKKLGSWRLLWLNILILRVGSHTLNWHQIFGEVKVLLTVQNIQLRVIDGCSLSKKLPHARLIQNLLSSEWNKSLKHHRLSRRKLLLDNIDTLMILREETALAVCGIENNALVLEICIHWSCLVRNLG